MPNNNYDAIDEMLSFTLPEQNGRSEHRQRETKRRENPHTGHRNRLKERYLNAGVEAFEKHVFLELILGYALPRCDTNPIAHNLLNTFGSISKICDAPIEDLIKIKGINRHTAVFLKIIPDICKVYYNEKSETDPILNTFEKIGGYVKNQFIGSKNEELFVLLLDAKYMILHSETIAKGKINSVLIDYRKIMQLALRFSASMIVIAHNHPKGIALPSANDVAETIKLVNVLQPFSIKVIDHIIVSENDYTSLAQSKDYKHIFR